MQSAPRSEDAKKLVQGALAQLAVPPAYLLAQINNLELYEKHCEDFARHCEEAIRRAPQTASASAAAVAGARAEAKHTASGAIAAGSAAAARPESKASEGADAEPELASAIREVRRCLDECSSRFFDIACQVGACRLVVLIALCRCMRTDCAAVVGFRLPRRCRSWLCTTLAWPWLTCIRRAGTKPSGPQRSVPLIQSKPSVGSQS